MPGFPSPADDYLAGPLDLNAHLIKHPAATFLMRATEDAMLKAGIHPGDILVVDRSLEPSHGRIVIASVEGSLTVKRLQIEQNRLMLLAENESYSSIRVDKDNGVEIWGVVTTVIHPV
ncbi:MAG: translesion error-prone DNA polymerase V autoproteolytic subunit [Pseudanabaenales cyanobacterium]|nr:translesion error-prone DNA polymerase V autoproteolytic subunit [Pseudanabaenales cyanobacterium]